MTARWLTRGELGAAGGAATGLLLVAPDLSSVFPLGPADRTACVRMTGEVLQASGVGAADRVVVALAEPAATLWTSAAADVAAAAASVGPRGRMRLHHALTTLRATTLVATPTGVMDFLARLHLEFLLDPLDLGLRHIVLTGEIASRHTIRQLAGEFGAAVSEVYSNPFSGGALAWRTAEEDPLTPVADGVLGLASLDKDVPYADGGLAEMVIMPLGHSTLGDAVLRTGQVVARCARTAGCPHRSTRWASTCWCGGVAALPRLEKALSKIDGVSGWELTVSRQGTLDSAVLTVTFGRQSLVANPMWQARIREALRALTPVTIGVEIAPEVGRGGPAGRW